MENISIVYSDNIIPFKETNESKCVASYVGVGEWELQECIKEIMAKNPEVTFNVIQYSRDDNRVFFYTDKPIALPEENRNKRVIEKDIAKKIDEILKFEDKLDTELVSIYSVLFVVRNMADAKKTNINGLKYDVEMELDVRYGYYSRASLSEMNYIDNTITMMIKKDKKGEPKPVVFTKEKGKLKVVRSEIDDADDVLRAAEKSLIAYYDYCMEHKPYETEMTAKIQTQMDGFSCDISKGGVRVAYQDRTANLEVIAPVEPFTFEKTSNREDVLKKLDGESDEFLAHLYVRISDCPSWCKEKIIDARNKEVKETIKQMKIDEFWNRILFSSKKEKKNKKKQK